MADSGTERRPARRRGRLLAANGICPPLAISGYRAAAMFVTERDRGLSAGALKPSIRADGLGDQALGVTTQMSQYVAGETMNLRPLLLRLGASSSNLMRVLH
jgi:hypothetical protein